MKFYNKQGWAEAVASAVARKERRQAFDTLDPHVKARVLYKREVSARSARKKRKGKR